jgi:N-acetylglutamate synthase-like GNAT family acetyltransferase
MPEIRYLMDFPQYLPIVAFWNYREWHEKDTNLDDIIMRYQKRMQRGKIPTALVAICDGMPTGTVSLKMIDLPERPDLTPWLASLYVLPDYRGRGIGRDLVRAAQAAAKEAGIKKLYLFTHTAYELYEKEKWIFLEESSWKGEISVAIYYKDL